MTTNGTTFNVNASNEGTGSISVNSGGVFTPALSAFNIPIEVPYTGVASLAGNVSYDTVDILPGTLPSGSTLNLNALAPTPQTWFTCFPGNFTTVATGATTSRLAPPFPSWSGAVILLPTAAT